MKLCGFVVQVFYREHGTARKVARYTAPYAKYCKHIKIIIIKFQNIYSYAIDFS